MDLYDYLSLVALAGMFSTGIWGGIRDYKRRKKGIYNEYRPRHYQNFDKRLEND
ncbi:hypothetical protein [Carboxylicivirga linearis]|uniref:Uncharacterized protein n=1 Tax=Carboxylicivirga linearis TaxID=1628157 RepID=A0ABS5K017_9BACT|nr:hypothetical protein [Carboxylicivirga linearis]MBS2100415.1 hypothetical protein [Carboxylicivirga linearis]